MNVQLFREEGGTMKRGANLGFITASSCVLAVVVLCAQPEGQWKGSMTTDKNGVTIVRNPKEPLYRGNVISFEEELKITGGEGEQAFRDLVSIGVDGDGGIYLLDGKAANIKVYDGSGRFLRVIGRRGQGPGEFGRPERLAITPQNEIMVSDPGRSLIHFLDIEGHYLRQLPQNFPFFSGPKFLSNGAMVDSEGRIFVRRFEAVDKGDRLFCEVFDPQGRYITNIVFPEKVIPALFHDGKLYTREEDEEGSPSVKRYKLKFLPSGK